MYRILPRILQLGFPATCSATRWGHFQPVAVNRAVSSHLDRVGLSRAYVPDSAIMGHAGGSTAPWWLATPWTSPRALAPGGWALWLE